MRVTFSDLIAGAALLLSAWSLYVSKKSLDQSKAAQAEQQSLNAEEIKSELLALLSDCKAVLNSARVDIGALQAVFASEPAAVRSLMENYVGLFTEYLPPVERAIADVESDHAAVTKWSGRLAIPDLMREKARIHEDLRTFEFAASQASHLVREFEERLVHAKRAVGRLND